ncbi:MAG: radical SAM/Cys-rich domain protein [Gammaproteobacteria bacterium]|jgi:radical SAM/Cys-rich protein|nr:radical SAM/Cys-rich domain protein [Gammaproteobacteria bacterium]MBT7308892.1 radical SAM/Cys-rich domain protein [Gammaproteobacteria bacterium]
MLDTAPQLKKIPFPEISRDPLQTLQVNLGYRCNLSCTHCHVNAGPKRTEMMAEETIGWVIRVLEQRAIGQLDLTGGAPEMNPYFRQLIEAARALNVAVIDRCNLAILEEPDQSDLASFLARNQVEVVASMPCYLQENVDSQRGKGTFDLNILGLQRLNRLGYGEPGSGKILNLVYNPQGASLPPPQVPLEADYKRILAERFDIHFNRLLTITNLPIHRFGSQLLSNGIFDDYMSLLQEAHLDQNLDSVMCRSLISVDWQGILYDCDFNQMLKLPQTRNQQPLQLSDLLDDQLQMPPIQVAGHCYGCTAGQGSSCGGALS